MINLTPGAVSEVKRLIAKENKPDIALRVGVRSGGCSGFSYVLGFRSASRRKIKSKKWKASSSS